MGARNEVHTDLLVVGSGIAGLTAALRASRTADVLLVTKTELAEGSTRYAQGGIAGALDPADSAAAHARDTLGAGAGLCDEAAVRVLCEEGPTAIRRLIDLGVAFDRTGGPDSSYAMCLEGAHSRPRILHAGGDATGRAIENALVAAVRERGIAVREQSALVDLRVEDGRVVGAELMTADGTRCVVRARATLLATGGAGQLFSHTTNPAVSTGDGIAAAARAGAALEDLEFYQFHPTALAAPGSFLISEAVRGEGAVVRDEQGRRFLPEHDPRAELAPRDVVARAIARVMDAQEGRPVLLDATGIGSIRLRERFPTIDAAVRAAGFDWGRVPVPVTPAAHYWMGGVRTDLDGRTSLPGLLAAGECARTGVHGANRLASNSLLEAAVFAARAVEAALSGCGAGAVGAGPAEVPWAVSVPAGSAPGLSVLTGTAATARPDRPSPAEPSPAEPSPAKPSPAEPSPPTGPSAGVDRRARADPSAPVDRAARADQSAGAWSRAALQDLMWSRAGLLRTGSQLAGAAAQLNAWRSPAPSVLTTVRALEDRNLLDLARLLTAHALNRPASVGAHHRLDAPISVPDSAQEALAC